jgi:hypothetical protein
MRIDGRGRTLGGNQEASAELGMIQGIESERKPPKESGFFRGRL